jgi:hypothetical protein
VQPLLRAIARARSLFVGPENERPPKAIEDDLESRYEIFKIRFFKEYKKYVLENSIVAVALAITLAVLAFKADDVIAEAWEPVTAAIVFFSLFPAPISLGVLWFDAGRQVKPMKQEADALEKRALERRCG